MPEKREETSSTQATSFPALRKKSAEKLSIPSVDSGSDSDRTLTDGGEFISVVSSILLTEISYSSPLLCPLGFIIQASDLIRGEMSGLYLLTCEKYWSVE